MPRECFDQRSGHFKARGGLVKMSNGGPRHFDRRWATCLGSRELLPWWQRVGLAKQQGKRVTHRLSKWTTDMERDGTSMRGSKSWSTTKVNVPQRRLQLAREKIMALLVTPPIFFAIRLLWPIGQSSPNHQRTRTKLYPLSRFEAFWRSRCVATGHHQPTLNNAIHITQKWDCDKAQLQFALPAHVYGEFFLVIYCCPC